MCVCNMKKLRLTGAEISSGKIIVINDIKIEGIKGHNHQKAHLPHEGMCACNMKTLQVTVSEISSGNETRTQCQTARHAADNIQKYFH